MRKSGWFVNEVWLREEVWGQTGLSVPFLEEVQKFWKKDDDSTGLSSWCNIQRGVYP